MKQSLTAVTAIMMLSTLGCASSGMHGYKVSPEFARRWGCDYEAVQREYRESQAELKEGYVWNPQVGWTVCKLLARVGEPMATGQVMRSEYLNSVTFYYRIPPASLLGSWTTATVTLIQDSRHPNWTVSSTIGF